MHRLEPELLFRAWAVHRKTALFVLLRMLQRTDEDEDEDDTDVDALLWSCVGTMPRLGTELAAQEILVVPVIVEVEVVVLFERV